MKNLRSETHHRESFDLVPAAPPVFTGLPSRGCSAARVRYAAACAAHLPPARRSARLGFATGGSAGIQIEDSFFVFNKTRTRL